nr:gliding motility-associated C-terminal domain-containing protein [uncultured Fluviicola sp.]
MQGYICSNNGVYRVDMGVCSAQQIHYLNSFSDLAVTPSGKVYLVNYYDLYLLDESNPFMFVHIATIDSIGDGFNTLLALNEEWLLGIRANGGLYTIHTSSGQTNLIGNIGYEPGGDLTFFKGHYYMVDEEKKLIRFDYNRYTHLLSSVEEIGTLDVGFSTYGVYGLTTFGSADCNSDSLKMIAFQNDDAYLVNPEDATCTLICYHFTAGIIAGSASITEVQNQIFEEGISSLVIPNIFTPNDDGINDFFEPSEVLKGVSTCSLSIFNRWGNEVVSRHYTGYYQWDGKTADGELCNDGVYYYKINLEGYCDDEKAELSGFVQLIR